MNLDFRELRHGEVRRITLPRTPVIKASNTASVEYIEPLRGRETLSRGKEQTRMSEQAQEVENKNIPKWAQGLYYSSGLTSEVLVYYDEEAIYFEHKGKDSGIVRFTFEQIEGLKIVEEEEESTDSAK
jgi:hypothetical protein